MSDMNLNLPRRRVGRPRTAEFILYFTLIFILAIPFGFAFWGRDVIRFRTLILRGPMARAWSEADRVTPMIFSV